MSGSSSNGVAPCQEQINKEAANGDSLLRMKATAEIEKKIMDLLREYKMNALA